jgi:DNA repair exonuclease SbcCD ATPase subunit
MKFQLLEDVKQEKVNKQAELQEARKEVQEEKQKLEDLRSKVPQATEEKYRTGNRKELDKLYDDIDKQEKKVERVERELSVVEDLIKESKYTEKELAEAFNYEFKPKFESEEIDQLLVELETVKKAYLEVVSKLQEKIDEFNDIQSQTNTMLNELHKEGVSYTATGFDTSKIAKALIQQGEGFIKFW